MRKFILLLCSLQFTYSITPSINGRIPSDVLENLSRQNIGIEYGNPGWIKKIDDWKNSESRNSQLELYLPILLGTYSDVSNTNFSASDYQNSLFDNNPSGTMKDYYDEISYGNFSVDGITNGWYQSSFTRSQAVGDTRSYVAEIAAMADPDIDYSQFDNDGPDNVPNSGDDDGYVDGIAVVYPGCMDGNNNIWPHQSSLYNNEYVTNDLSINGGNIIVSTYMVCPELPGNSNCITTDICPIGVYAHEFGHVLGLPDLYDRDNSDGDSEGLGNWCLMASGSWGGWWGDTPVHMSSWCKIQMGWLEPTTVTSDSYIQISQLATSSSAIKIWEDNYYWNRYFLVENRQPLGFDSEINGSGLIIYHIDENRGWGENGWSFGSVNDDELNKMVDLEAADGFTHLDDEINRGDNGDPFPGITDNRIFSNISTPSSNRNDGTESEIAIFNISDSDSVMGFDVDYRPPYGYAIAYDENGIAPTTFGIGTTDQWSAVLFTAEHSGYITEVDFGLIYSSFWDDEVMDWVVYVYDSFDGSSPGNLMDSVYGSSIKSDWESVSIDSVYVTEGQDFFISIKFINETYAFCFDNTGVLSGRSYLSGDGVTYDNLLSAYGDANIRAKISTNELTSSIAETGVIPNQFKMFPNYPNPFNPRTTFTLSLNSNLNIKIDIYNSKGQHIYNIHNGNLIAGNHSLSWNGSDHPSGLYFLKTSSNYGTQTQKLLLLK